jgi:hypothetical protein
VAFYTGEVLDDFPKSVNVVWGSMKQTNGTWTRAGQLGSLPLSPAPPPLDPKAPIPIGTRGRDALIKLGFPVSVAESIAAESKSGPFGDAGAFLSRMKARYGSFSRPVDFEALYWGQVQSLMASNNLTF